MTKLKTLILTALACLAAAPAFAQQAQIQQPAHIQPAQTQLAHPQFTQVAPQPAPQPTSPTVGRVVPAQQMWMRTGVQVQNGGHLQVRTDGSWTAAGGQSASNLAAVNVTLPMVNADGYPNTANQQQLLLPSANRGALIGKIGDNGAPFLIGATFDGDLNADGELLLSMNEAANAFGDNQGRMPTSLTVTAPPPPEQTTPPAETPPAQAPVDTTIATPAPDGPADGATLQPRQPLSLVQLGLIGAAVLVVLLVIGQFFRPRRPDPRSNVNVPNITTQISSDGIAGQSLTIRVKGRS